MITPDEVWLPGVDSQTQSSPAFSGRAARVIVKQCALDFPSSREQLPLKQTAREPLLIDVAYLFGELQTKIGGRRAIGERACVSEPAETSGDPPYEGGRHSHRWHNRFTDGGRV